MATKKQILAALRRRYGEKARLGIRTNRNAKLPAEREAARARRKEMHDRIDQIKRESRDLDATKSQQELLEAARFAVDVNGDDPSLLRLRKAVETLERLQALCEERIELSRRLERLDWIIRGRKHDAYHDSSVGGIGFRHVVASADTLDELLNKIRSTDHPFQ